MWPNILPLITKGFATGKAAITLLAFSIFAESFGWFFRMSGNS